jgi:hypothetical protein
VLGAYLHCRCEACGWTFYVPAPPLADTAMLEAAAIVEAFLEERCREV